MFSCILERVWYTAVTFNILLAHIIVAEYRVSGLIYSCNIEYTIIHITGTYIFNIQLLVNILLNIGSGI